MIAQAAQKFDLAQRAADLGVDYCIMYEPTKRRFPHLAFLWPALAAASASEIAALAAKHFAGLAFGAQAGPAAAEPQWTKPNSIALELKTVRSPRSRPKPETRHEV